MAFQAQPNLVTLGYHVQVVQYDDQESLRYALNGVDTVISTVSGPPQYKLIEAAVQKRVRRFAPAEFDGIPSLRPAGDPLDRDRANALQLLEHYKAYMQYTVFACGIFYERFAPGGMAATGLGRSSGISGEGDYLLNIRNMAGEAPLYNSSNQHAVICMTAVQDVARFVVRAVDLADWPPVLSMYSERMIVYQFVGYVQQLTGRPTTLTAGTPTTLRARLAIAASRGDVAAQWRLHHLIATAEGRYDLGASRSLNAMFPEIRTTSFRDWFLNTWAGV
ncbi:hypothetical protein W97_03304 [Coniosporium apollinis CBS 100218]|uniref:Uncharacterized protein n=1 Tax=Coniosporium apollinis (strain CBS 100218) TaxID=1168221 RepID=R7YQI4_CONA1|nr:uncharacterized protein W97_03304 [Coniosporium apollinis CBS 100218]EON64074.1 hypothetical protein W97_03304 [Coniosporium apollinis CBS 100218]